MEIIKVNINNLEDGLYLFSIANCPTCEKLKQLLNEIESDQKIIELNAYEHQEICQKLGLMGTPCLIEYRDNKEFDRMYGAPNNKRVMSFLKGE